MPQPTSLRLAAVGGQGLDRLWSAWDAPGYGCRLAARSETRGRALLAVACEGRFRGGLDRPDSVDGGALRPTVGRRCVDVWQLSGLLAGSLSRRAE